MASQFITPEWVQNAIFYQVFPDRFAKSDQIAKPNNLETWESPPTTHGFKGGDLLGILEHIDYLQDLGISAIYLNPIFQSAANHRYHTHDYFIIDPILGGNTAFEKLLSEAHKRDIRIILDGVFNHASRGFFQFNHILESGEASPYRDWFRIHGYPLKAYSGKPNYDCWWDLPALPEFNHANPQVREFIFSISKYWLDRGIDGWRLDVPACVQDDTFWQEFREIAKSANPDAYIVGEISDDASQWLQGDMFDGVMNYLLTYACWRYFPGTAIEEDQLGHWAAYADTYQNSDTFAFNRDIIDLLEKYPKPAVLSQLNILSSHDTPRFLTLLQGKKDLFRLAIIFQMTYPGAPCIYYGDEIGLEGGRDPDCRKTFPWDEHKWDHDLRRFIKRCVEIRKQHHALRNGKLTTLFVHNDFLVYLRHLDNNSADVVVILNRSGKSCQLEVPVSNLLSNGQVFSDALGLGTARVVQDKLIDLTIPPYTGCILLQSAA